MRKFLALTLGLSLVAIMTFGAIGSAAWFTSSDTVAVTATSGKITVTGSPTFTLSNLMPGVWTDPVQFKIYNHNTPDSTVPVKFRVTEQLLDQTIDGFYAQILVQATGRYCDGAELGSPVYQGLLMDLTFDNSTTPTLWNAGLPINYHRLLRPELQAPERDSEHVPEPDRALQPGDRRYPAREPRLD